MTPLFDALARWPRRPFGTIVHLGAGDGAVLDDYAVLAPACVWLVEGDADALSELQARARPHAWAQVRRAVVAPQSGRVEWHRYNLRKLNGPREPLGLMAFYPRLRALGSAAVEAVALADLLAALPARQADEGERLLVIDLPGQEQDLLASLPQDLLRGFDGVLLRGCGVKGPGLGNTAEAAVRHLLGRCFRSTAAVDSEPLWPVHLLAYDRAAEEQAAWQARALALEETLAALRAEQQALQATLEAERENARLGLARALALEETLAALRAEQQALQATLEAEREQARLGLAKAQQAHASEASDWQARLAAVTQERDEQAKLAVGRRAQMDAAFQERDQQTRLAAERQQQVEALTQARDGLTRERDEFVRQLAVAAKQADATAAELAKALAERESASKRHADQLAKLTQELAEARQTASLSVKLQMLREADLRELQSRYQAAQAQQQGQHELLTKLAQRLSLATQYFQQLSLEQQQGDLVENQAVRPQ